MHFKCPEKFFFKFSTEKMNNVRWEKNLNFRQIIGKNAMCDRNFCQKIRENANGIRSILKSIQHSFVNALYSGYQTIYYSLNCGRRLLTDSVNLFGDNRYQIYR